MANSVDWDQMSHSVTSDLLVYMVCSDHSIRIRSFTTIRQSKQALTDKIAEKLKSDNISSRSWWSILKSFIAPSSNSSLPPLDHNGRLYTENQEKANLLNYFFCEQTVLNDQNAALPNLTPHAVVTPFTSLILRPDKVQSVLKSLADGKASGPNGLNNKVLRELASEISEPSALFLIIP